MSRIWRISQLQPVGQVIDEIAKDEYECKTKQDNYTHPINNINTPYFTVF